MEQIVDVLIGPFAVDFMQRALIAGLLTALTCSLVGTWVVLRGLTFMGDALAHGVLPGIAVAYVVLGGGDVATTVGAALAAVVVIAGVNVVQRHSHLPEDAGIGLLFIGMLALGVMIISRGSGYFGDLLGFLFGAALGVTAGAIAVQAVAAAIALVSVVVLHRAFLALSFDERKAQGLGLYPRAARIALLALIALAIISSFRTVGNLLVYGLLIAPPATASLLARRVPVMMTVSVGIGMLSVYAGLLCSYYFDLAAGAAMAGFAVATFFVVLTVAEAARGVRTRAAGTGPPARSDELADGVRAAEGAPPATGGAAGH